VTLDIPTLFVVTVFTTAVVGFLLLFSWLQNRSTRALAWWGTAFVLLAPAIGLFGLRGTVADVWSIQIANTLLMLGYGVLWTGARVFENRRPLLRWAFAGAVIWLVACQFDVFMQSTLARATLAAGMIAAYSAMFAWELWQGRHDGLLSRWPAMAVIVAHALLFPFRIPAILALPFPLHESSAGSGLSPWLVFAPLLYIYALAFLLMGLTKERAELNQRRAATTDLLTGIPNRRGFSERAERVILRCKRDSMPLTMLLFDLDNFKSINDRFGHRAGDLVLTVFSRSATQSLRPLDLLGRIGGEEFVALLPGVAPETVVEVAERVRDAFALAAAQVEGQVVGATVSIGTASAAQDGYNFDALYASADAALYRAKRKGRNRIEPGRPMLAPVPEAS
jgi:diguanylate cyclase (GGDEF)-like protein